MDAARTCAMIALLWVPLFAAENIAPALAQVAELDAASLEWRQTAERFHVPVEGERVLCVLDANARHQCWDGDRRLNADRVFKPAVSEAIHALGGTVQPGSTPGYLVILAEPRVLKQIAALDPESVLLPFNPPAAVYGGVESQGMAKVKASQWHARELTGQGARIAVLDLGYGGVDGRMAGEIGDYHAHASQSSLSADTEVHGTACAEIIRDVAPDAELYLYRLYGMGAHAAVSDALAHGCSVISVSLAWMGYPANGPECDAVRLAEQGGMAWVNAAGNWQQKKYWEVSNATGQTGWVEFAPGTTLNPVGEGLIELGFSFEAPNPGWARYKVCIFEDTGNGPVLVAESTPLAYFQYLSYQGRPGAKYLAGIECTMAGIPGRLRLQTFRNTFGVYSAAGSISNPATVPASVTAGAVHYGSYSSSAHAEAYSSRGGGVFGLEIDLCGPSSCATLSYDGYAFVGTSCAAPHIAAMLALASGTATYASDPLAALDVLDVAAPGWDPDTGWGISRLAVLGSGDGLALLVPRLMDCAVDLPCAEAWFRATGGSEPYGFAAIGLPSGLTMESDGRLHGTPQQAGAFMIQASVIDGAGNVHNRALELTVLPRGSLLLVAPARELGPWASGQRVVLPVFTAAGGDGAYHYSVVAGALPDGLALTAQGQLQGVPRHAGRWSFVVRVTDASGASHETRFWATVRGASPLSSRSGSAGCTADGKSWLPIPAVLLAGIFRTCRRRRAY